MYFDSYNSLNHSDIFSLTISVFSALLWLSVPAAANTSWCCCWDEVGQMLSTAWLSSDRTFSNWGQTVLSLFHWTRESCSSQSGSPNRFFCAAVQLNHHFDPKLDLKHFFWHNIQLDNCETQYDIYNNLWAWRHNRKYHHLFSLTGVNIRYWNEKVRRTLDDLHFRSPFFFFSFFNQAFFVLQARL